MHKITHNSQLNTFIGHQYFLLAIFYLQFFLSFCCHAVTIFLVTHSDLICCRRDSSTFLLSLFGLLPPLFCGFCKNIFQKRIILLFFPQISDCKYCRFYSHALLSSCLVEGSCHADAADIADFVARFFCFHRTRWFCISHLLNLRHLRDPFARVCVFHTMRGTRHPSYFN